jgi:hypothetical protein
MSKASIKNSQSNDKQCVLMVIVIAGILTLGFALRFYQLDRDLGGGDEAAMLLYFGFSSFKFIVTNYFDTNNHIFHTLLVRLMVFIFGEENAVAIRLPSFIFGVAGLWMIYCVGKKIFNSQVAKISLLIAALSPIHIHYSQTARGYSLIIFFSMVMFYSTLKILETKTFFKWGSLLIISGFLSIYTIPTNVYFSFALFIWTISILLIPTWSNQYHLNEKMKWLSIFLTVYTSIALLSLLAYWNLIDQIPDAIGVNQSVQTQIETASGWNLFLLIPKILFRCFEGPQKWFLPIIIAGIIGNHLINKGFRYLTIFIFFLPLSLNIILGYTGFARNYLFNWPFLIIFLSAGFISISGFISRFLPKNFNKNIIIGIFISIYALCSFQWMFSYHYPRQAEEFRGNLSTNKIGKEQIKNNDLLIINDPRHYLYARKTYKENIKNIITKNKLDGIKMLASQGYSLEDFEIKTQSGMWKIFKGQIIENKFIRFQATNDKDLISLTGNESASNLEPNFETQSNWDIVSGKGEISIVKKNKFSTDKVLSLHATPERNLVVQARSPINFSTKQTGLLVLLWTMKRINSQIPAYYPALSFQFGSDPKKTNPQQLPFGKVNEGMNILASEDSSKLFANDWSINTILGKIPPGNYSFKLWLKCHSDNTVLYDNFRLFFIPSPIDLSKGFGGP